MLFSLSFSICSSSFAYKRTTDFCQVILYLVTVSCRSFQVEFSRSLMRTIASSANKHTLTSSFLTPVLWCPCLTALDKTSMTLLDRYGESGMERHSFQPMVLVKLVAACGRIWKYVEYSILYWIGMERVSSWF